MLPVLCTTLALHALSPLVAWQEPEPAEPPESVGAQVAEEDTWELSASVFYSDPPGSRDRVTPIVYADRGPLHLELRYNYEDLETASLFAGWTFEAGEELAASITPMFGAVFGDTEGLAPGLELDVGWRRIAWYSESEYVFGLDDRDDDYFYSWSTLTYGLTDALSAGIVIERTKIVDTDYSVQRGLALQWQRESLGLSLYVYNLGDDDSYVVFALGLAP
jgi:hypothetical protein